MNPRAELDFSSVSWFAGRWGHEIQGHPDDAHHQLGFEAEPEHFVTLAEAPLRVVSEDMEPDGKGGSRVASRVELDAETTGNAVMFLADAANNHKALVKALADCIPLIRGQPEFRYELRQAAQALIACGLSHVCNGDLADDL